MPSTPRLLGDRYRLVQVVASGGMGQVWEAVDELLGRTVAIKEVRFPSDVPEEERAVMGERTMREAKLTARLTHRGIITIYDVICVEDRPFIVMELVRAPSLARQIDEHGPQPPTEVAELGLQLLDALSVAHGQGILHRDVKPSNVLLAPHRVVLTDFGIATSENDATLTSTGLLVGSPAYMAPERLRGEDIGPPADIWSVGATLYAAVEGVPPFRAGTTIGTITAVLVDEPERPYVGGQLREAIVGMLDKDVSTRLTGTEAVDLLHMAVRERTAQVVPPAFGDALPGLGHQPPVMAPVAPWNHPLHVGDDGVGHLVAPPVPVTSFSFVATPPPSPPGDIWNATEGRGGGAGLALGVDRSGRASQLADDVPEAGGGRGSGRWITAALLLAAAIAAVALIWTRLTDSGQSTSNNSNAGTHRNNTSGPQHPGRHVGRGPSRQHQKPHHHRPSQRSPLTTPPSQSPVTTSSPPPSTSPSSTPPTTSATSGGGAGAPAGYQLVSDPLGFQVAVPDGWQRRYTGATYVDYVSPVNSAMYLRIDQTPQAKPSAVGAWRQYEPSLASRLPGFHLVRLQPVAYRQWQAADLEWTWQGSNGTLHVLDRGFITDPRGFALLMSGPDATWQSESLPVFDVAASTFQPTP